MERIRRAATIASRKDLFARHQRVGNEQRTMVEGFQRRFGVGHGLDQFGVVLGEKRIHEQSD